MKRDMDLIRELLLKLENLPMQPGHTILIMPGDPRLLCRAIPTMRLRIIFPCSKKLSSSSVRVRSRLAAASAFAASLGRGTSSSMRCAIQRFDQSRRRAQSKSRDSRSTF